jgi:broad specificity phosphatase PhoE
MRLVLIPCGHTEWHAEGRLLGRVELPLTAAGQTQCLTWIEPLRMLGVGRIAHGPDELSAQTAQLVAQQLGIPTKEVGELVGVDVGLWAGLTDEQLEARYPSAFRELEEAPLNVHPPEGESLSGASERLRAAVRKYLKKKNGTGTVGFVLRPLAFALVRCALEQSDCSVIWQRAHNAVEPVIMDYEEPPRGKARKAK